MHPRAAGRAPGWGLKLLADREKLMQAAQAGSDELAAQVRKAAARTCSAPAERQLREAADGLAAEVAEDVHARSRVGRPTPSPVRPRTATCPGTRATCSSRGLPRAGRPGGRDARAGGATRDAPPAAGCRLELTVPWPCTTSYPAAAPRRSHEHDDRGTRRRPDRPGRPAPRRRCRDRRRHHPRRGGGRPRVCQPARARLVGRDGGGEAAAAADGDAL